MVIVCEKEEFTDPRTNEKRMGFYMDGLLQKNLDFEIKRVRKDWDCIMLIDGQEGAAKTTFASAVARYMSSQFGTKFDINDVIYTTDQFNNWVATQPPESVCVWDEFVLAGLSTEALSKIQNALVKQMTIMRQKRLVVILIVPYIFLLRKYFAIARTRFLINIYSPDNLKRGFFRYYSYPNKRYLFMKGVKHWEYMVQKPDIIGRFTNTFGYFYDLNTYNEKKEEAMKSLRDIGDAGKQYIWKPRFWALIFYLRKTLPWDDISLILNMPVSTLRSQNAEYKKQNPENP